MSFWISSMTLPPTTGCEQPHSELTGDRSVLRALKKGGPWPAGRPIRAGVSAMGFGGINAHVVLEEAPKRSVPARSRPWQLLMVSARSEQALDQATVRLADHLEADSGQALADVAYTLQVGREAFTERLAFTVSSRNDMQERLRAFLAGSDAAAHGLARGWVRRDREVPAWSAIGTDLCETIEQRQYAGLLDLWVQGLEVDWHRLWPERPCRISLPTYPFAGQRYWVERPARQVGQDDDAAFEHFHSALLDRLMSEEIAIDEALQILRESQL